MGFQIHIYISYQVHGEISDRSDHQKTVLRRDGGRSTTIDIVFAKKNGDDNVEDVDDGQHLDVGGHLVRLSVQHV